MRVFLPLLMLSFLFAHSNDPVGYNLVCALKLNPDAVSWRKLREHLSTQVKPADVEREMKAMAIPQERVIRVGEKIGSGNSGVVFSVKTADGPRALKIYFEPSPLGTIFQRVLGHFGVAPKVHGVLSAEELRKLEARSPELRDILKSLGAHAYGVLMESIENVWTVKTTYDPVSKTQKREIPQVASKWDRTNLVNQFDAIETILGRLHILPVDRQVMVTAQGKVYLVDTDHYVWLSENDTAYTGVLENREQVVKFARSQSKKETESGNLRVTLDPARQDVLDAVQSFRH